MTAPNHTPTEPSKLRRALARDKTVISYRPELNRVIGKVTATVLFQQILYYSDLAGDQPFYMFREPCAHDRYQTGKSWTEVLGISAYEFDGAIAAIGTKVTKGKSKQDAFAAIELCNLVIYWTDASRITWYQLNLRLTEALLDFAYSDLSGNSTFSNYLANSTFSNYPEMGKSRNTYIEAENDPEKIIIDLSKLGVGESISTPVRDVYEQVCGLIASPLLSEQITQAERDYPQAWIIQAIVLAGAAGPGKNNWAYVTGILRRWQTEGRDAAKASPKPPPAPPVATPLSPTAFPPGVRTL